MKNTKTTDSRLRGNDVKSTVKKIYIAGKVTGLPYEEVRVKFALAEEELKLRGFEAVNPLIVVNDPKANWNQAMKKCISSLVLCDAVYLLPCATNSKGATLEMSIASQIDMPLFTKVDNLFQHFLL